MENNEVILEAAKLVVSSQVGSTSLLQRKMRLGYEHACNTMRHLYSMGIVGINKGTEPRKVLIPNNDELVKHLDKLKNNSTNLSQQGEQC